MKVAIAVIKDEAGRILIARRALDTTLGGFWEFPGGKLEATESPETAMVREIYEELGLRVLISSQLTTIEQDSLTLYVFLVSQFEGTPSNRVSQLELRWITVAEIPSFSFPPANEKILKYLNSSMLHRVNASYD